MRTNIIRSSYPAGALADLADTLDVGLVAMSSHARTGAARLALGSVTMGSWAWPDARSSRRPVRRLAEPVRRYATMRSWSGVRAAGPRGRP